MNTWEEKILDRQEAYGAGLAEGLSWGKSIGIVEGINRANEETALRMKEKGFEYHVISEITKLSVEDIEAL